MCGITALFAYGDDAAPVSRQEVESITQRMFARGPDAGGTWFSADGRVGLGSRRLAIIDLSPDGEQPMLDSTGELAIVFNGEIYNYAELRERLIRRGATFRSHGDTEVLLEAYRAYGAEMVELLRGMFAFCIWDSRTRQMFVARDPYGIKPLFIADDGRTLRIASQVKALLAGGAISRTRDPAGTAGFFLLGSVPEPFTMYDSIRCIEAGTSFFVGARGREQRRHHSIAAVLARAARQQTTARLVEPATLMRELVSQSVASHLVADVPVGAFLSAGIDSTTLVALAEAAGDTSIRTVTLAFEEFRGTPSDESPLAERFARERGTTHTTRVVTRDEFHRDIGAFFEAMDQPTIDGTNTWFVSKAAAEEGLKVALSGLGGDELFGSYPSFRDLPRIVSWSRSRLRSPMMRLAARTLRRRNPKTASLAQYGDTYAGAYLVKRGLFLPEELASVIGAETAEEGLRRLDLVARIGQAIDPDPATPFGRVAALEASLYMRNQLLRDTDWSSMAHSLEVRTPLVDAHLLRQLAPLLLQQGRDAKQLFAAAALPPLPEWLTNRRKTGFAVPLKEWMSLPPDGTSTRMRSWARVVMERYG